MFYHLMTFSTFKAMPAHYVFCKNLLLLQIERKMKKR